MFMRLLPSLVKNQSTQTLADATSSGWGQLSKGFWRRGRSTLQVQKPPESRHGWPFTAFQPEVQKMSAKGPLESLAAGHPRKQKTSENELCLKLSCLGLRGREALVVGGLRAERLNSPCKWPTQSQGLRPLNFLFLTSVSSSHHAPLSLCLVAVCLLVCHFLVPPELAAVAPP